MVSLQRENFFISHKDLQNLHQIISNLKNIFNRSAILKEVIINTFEYCEGCKEMAALPQGAFVACKLRDQTPERGLIVARLKSGGEKDEPKIFSGNKKLMEYSPVKYNGKLMNSIWGLYNRYSPHNIKSNEIVSYGSRSNQQQQFAVVKQAIAYKNAMAIPTDMKWN